MTATLQQVLQEFRRGLETIYGPRLAGLYLFGSQARGDALPDSDVDVLVVLQGPVNPHEEIHRLSAFKTQLGLKYDVVISCVYVSEAEYRRGETPLLRNVLREGVPL